MTPPDVPPGGPLAALRAELDRPIMRLLLAAFLGELLGSALALMVMR